MLVKLTTERDQQQPAQALGEQDRQQNVNHHHKPSTSE
jgi:hypothetical protein